jgi:phosphoglucosamine mutase
LLVKEYGFSGGVMISASHNPYFDNGLKVFGKNGTKLGDSAEAEIERRVFERIRDGGRESDAIAGTLIGADNRTLWPSRYEKLLADRFPDGPWMKGLRLVVDCAHGAMSAVAPGILGRLGAEATPVFAVPSGTNINAGCGAVHLEALLAVMAEGGVCAKGPADFGVAFDGDGDRALFVSRSGRIVDGDAVLLILARRMKKAGRLVPPVVVGTSMTNFGLERLLGREGIALVRADVGDRFIFEEMRKGAVLGGEPSGHTILPDFGLSGDGLFTALNVAWTVVEEGLSLDDLIEDWVPAPHLMKGLRVARKIPLEAAPMLKAAVARASRAVRGRGRVVVRYSGTEPLLRLMIESDDAADNERWMAELIAAAQTEIGEADERWRVKKDC